MPITEHLMKLEENVCDEESFLRFVVALAEDWEDEREKEKQRQVPLTAPAQTDGERYYRRIPRTSISLGGGYRGRHAALLAAPERLASMRSDPPRGQVL